MVLFLIAQLLYMRYRSKSEIFGRVLAIANGQGVTRTGIMYKAFLSFTQAKAILTTLTYAAGMQSCNLENRPLLLR